jgi:2-polyprenyl-6-methoxyphenol hydroxylase-like FAD-dependent oxidoreductase
LRKHLAKFNVNVELGTELTSFDQDVNGVFARVVRHENGDHHHETISARWLVGAEGGKSQCSFLSPTHGICLN